jgi:mannose-1-phosphate guanylyltransferase
MMDSRLWTVILAAGAGRRLAGVTDGVPKQFWREPHGRSLIAQTLDRFGPLSPLARRVAVVDASHREHVSASGLAASVGTIVVQPRDRGTAVGVLLSILPVLDAAPDDVVAITPSDHGVADTTGFQLGVLEAAWHVRQRGDIVLFGVEPSAALMDYGWISVDPAPHGGLHPVRSFVEKPGAIEAARLFLSGAVWNTMILVARASALRVLFSRLLPDISDTFAVAEQLRDADRRSYLDLAYGTLTRRDFSRDLLARARGLSAFIWPSSLGWSDLGTPERLRDWQHRSQSASAVA